MIESLVALAGGLQRGQYHDVQRPVTGHPEHSAAKTLSDHAFDTVAANSFCTGFPGNGHAQTMLRQIVGPRHDPEIFIGRPDGLLKNRFELFWLQ
jgi:hypothetical protein